MAHADYNCCAICDCKMGYGGFESETKKDICDECFKDIKKINLDIKNLEDLKQYIEKTDYTTLKETLIKLNYRFCYYGNDVDDLIMLSFQPSGMNFEEYIKRIDKYNYDIVKKEGEN